ncbi:MAG: diaminopimelate decarboxylase, partial [Pseudomonadota bacterium]
MSHFVYANGKMHAEDVPLERIAAEFGTPVYVYSSASLTENFLSYANACRANGRGEQGALICYSVKSNSNLAVLSLLGKLG